MSGPDSSSQPSSTWRKWLLWSAAALVLVLLGMLTVSWVMRDSSPQFTERLRTEAGSRQLGLPDGSRIEAGPDTVLGVAYYSRRRHVSLAQGEATFRVRWLYRAAFTVQSGLNEVVIEGSRLELPDIVFSVAAAPEQLKVAVKEGALKVRTVTAGPREFVELQAGDLLTIDMGSRTHSVSRP
ncbi:FecR domain-containing protein [Pigmentiphaga sp.]|mgnify:FL=1|uniref:FecR domain-containing protein n=1 Tax=Pigmentiphaga sp. TaxID=1977564 RepID=UPI0025DD645E|nr:FecR domain-containing protein [Pigmentiphaga sp.]MBX6317923.1 FecR domain-containing protein [Pigmentiphaga sp.]